MGKTTLTLAILLGFSAHAKSWTFVYSENGRWRQQNISLDKNGWPRIEQDLVTHKKPAAFATATPLFSVQKNELKNDDGATLWPVTHQWDWEWELKYTEWVKNEINASWWKDHGIVTDCADALISARWIFARVHGLPTANHLTTGAYFTERSVKPEWENLPTDPDWTKDRRFLTALEYLLQFTFTHTLWQDSYPVAINADSLLPGGYHLDLHDNTGHTQFIYKVGTHPDEVPMTTLNSTTPRELRDLFEFIFLEDTSASSGDGFVRMRWPIRTGDQVDLVPAEQMPHYSLEQFDPNFIQSPRTMFWQEVFYRLDPNADYNVIAVKVANELLDLFQERVKIVEDGFRVCGTQHCAPGSPAYEAWSTPSRDLRILQTISILNSILSMVTSSGDIHQVLATRVLNLNGRDWTVNDLIEIWNAGTFSSDPNDTPEKRWGLPKGTAYLEVDGVFVGVGI